MSSSTAAQTTRPNHLLAALAATALLCVAGLAFALASSAAAPAENALTDVEFLQAATQPDGKVVVAGTTTSRTFVARFGTDGRLDMGFGESGIAWPELASDRGTTNGLAIGSGGEITVSFGDTLRGGEGGFSALLRLDGSGRPDPRFGVQGLETFGSSSIPAVVALADGAALIWARGRSEPDNFKDRLLRIEPDGSIDPDFAIETSTGALDYLVDAPAIGPDGKIYIASVKNGEVSDPRKQLVVTRSLPNGQPDPGFGDGGVAAFTRGEGTDPFVQSNVTGFAVEGDGDVVLSVWTGRGYKAGGEDALFRVSGNGSAIAELGPTGCVGRVAIGPEGTITVAGPVSASSYFSSCIETFDAAGARVSKLDPASGVGLERVLAVEPDGRVLATGAIFQTGGGTMTDHYLGAFTVNGLDRGFGMAFLPTLGCRGRNPTAVSQPTWADSDESFPTGPMGAKGTDGRDVIVGSRFNDKITGMQGKDLICARSGPDRVWGGPAPDRIFGGAGPDRIFGGPGRDVLRGGPGRDRIKR